MEAERLLKVYFLLDTTIDYYCLLLFTNIFTYRAVSYQIITKDRKDPTRPGHVLAPVLNARTLGHPSLH